MVEEESITSKYFVNLKNLAIKENEKILSQKDIITECLIGQILSNSNLIYYPENNFIYDKSQLPLNTVKLICGGGSGHEPAHAGFVSPGMLTCAVCGDIFSSPSCANIIKAIEKTYTENGTILIVKNYTGDVINFSMACELFKSQGKKVEMLIVDDDISLTNLNETTENDFNKRRGLCGTVLVYKILGNLSFQGYNFDELILFGKNIIKSLYTIGVSLTTCIPPFSKINKKELMNENEFELGLGIHGEKGKERIKYNSVDDVIEKIFNCFENNIKKEIYNEMKDVVIVINNLGSLTDIEMNIIIKCLFEYLFDTNNNKKKFNVVRIVFGKLMTSLDMKGFSITIFNLNENDFIKNNTNKILFSIDSKINSENWNVIQNPLMNYINNIKNNIIIESKPEKKIFSEENKNNKTFNVINELFNFLLTKKEELNTLDKKVGDGDIGTGMFNAISKSLLNLKYLDFNNDLKNCYKQIADDIGAGFGGTSGPLYMSFILCGLQSIENKESENNIKNYLNALKEGSKMIMKVGKAKVGDRTMIDYLVPMSEILEKCENIDDLKKVFNDNRLKLLEDIKKLKSKRGRSSYLNGQEVGLDEPGCVLCDFWIKFVIDKLG
jgi:dihydroxyacetone kinase